jgi:hypothetical protein
MKLIGVGRLESETEHPSLKNDSYGFSANLVCIETITANCLLRFCEKTP